MNQGLEDFQCLRRGLIRVVEERVELDRQPAVVAGCADGRDDLGEIDGTGAGHEVVVDPAGRDVLEVVVADVRRQLGDRPGQVFADAERVADVEVQADRRGIQPLGDFEVLVGRLQQQAGLGLDQEQDAQLWACSASGLRTSTNRSMACCRDWPGASGPPGSVVMWGAPSSAQRSSARRVWSIRTWR